MAPKKGCSEWELGVKLFICVKPMETLLVGIGVVLKLSPMINRNDVRIKSKALGNHWLWHLISMGNMLI